MINIFYKTFVECEMPTTSHCMIWAVGKGLDRAHGMSNNKVLVKLKLAWAMLSQGPRLVASRIDGGHVL